MVIEDNRIPCTLSFVTHCPRIYHTHGYLSRTPSYVPTFNVLTVGYRSADMVNETRA